MVLFTVLIIIYQCQLVFYKVIVYGFILCYFILYKSVLFLQCIVFSSTDNARYVHSVINSPDSSSGDVYDSDGEAINFDSGKDKQIVFL